MPLVSDLTHEISKKYCNCTNGLHGLFIISPTGILRHFQITAEAHFQYEEVNRLIDAFKFSDQYGEVCPASWRLGDPSLTPDPENENMKYFEN